MTTLVRTDTLEPWRGEPLPRSINTAVLHYEDGRRETVQVQAYVIELKHPTSIKEVWTDDELAAIGLVRVPPFVAPDGKRTVGAPRYERVGGAIAEVRDVEDVPPPLTATEKLAEFLTFNPDVAVLLDAKPHAGKI